MTGPAAAAPAAVDDLEQAIRERLREAPGPLLQERDEVVVLDAGARGRWTVRSTRGRLSVHRGGDSDATLTVRATLEVLTDVVRGSVSGVKAFLDGDLTVRGNLALSLSLDGFFQHADQPAHWPRAAAVDANGVRTSYLEAGSTDAPTLLMLHGLGATNASLLALLWDLADGFHVLAPDLPGFGASAKPRAPYSFPWFAQWAEGFLNAVGVEQAHVLGNSLGGRVALELGLSHGPRVRSLVLLTPSPAFRRLRQFVPVVRLLRPELALVGMPLSHRAVVEGIRVMLSRPDRLRDSWYDAAADEFKRIFKTRAGRVAFFACLRQIYLEEAHGERGFWDRLPALEAPALFVWGDRDRLVPASFARHVATALPDAGSVVMEDCGHVPQFEHPEETAAMVREFVRQHSGAGQ